MIVPLDGSSLAEQVLPDVTELAKKMKLDVTLVRAYALPPAVATDYGFISVNRWINGSGRADYLEEKAGQMRKAGVNNVSSFVHIGYGAEEIIQLAQQTPDNLIAMYSDGRSGVKRWVLGSVTERVVRHSGDPVLIIRAINRIPASSAFGRRTWQRAPTLFSATADCGISELLLQAL